MTSFAEGETTGGQARWIAPTSFVVPDGWDIWSPCMSFSMSCGQHYRPGDVVQIPGYWTDGSPSGSHASSGDPFMVDFGAGYQGEVNAGPNSVQVVFASAVPEPGTYALMLAGLGLVGVARSRRRQQA
jgi:hypothetical protein